MSTSGFPDNVYDILMQPRVAQFIYYTVIILTGYILLYFLTQDGLVFTEDLSYLLIWLFLIILMQPPEAAAMESEPFEDPGIIR